MAIFFVVLTAISENQQIKSTIYTILLKPKNFAKTLHFFRILTPSPDTYIIGSDSLIVKGVFLLFYIERRRVLLHPEKNLHAETISIVIPVYNAQDYLDRCITSILTQTYETFECWLVDDSSTDDSGKLCEQWAQKDSRIKVIHLPDNHGSAAARNIALDRIKEQKKSAYIAFIDCDDYIHPTYLERLLTILKETDTDISWVGVTNVMEAHALLFNDDVEITEDPVILETKNLLLDENQRIMYSMVWGKLFKAALWDDVRMPESCRFFQDGATTFRALYNARTISVSQEKLYYYYYSPESETRSAVTEEKCRNGLFTATEKIDFYSQRNEYELLEMAYVGYANTILKNLERSKELENGKIFYKEMWALYKSIYMRIVKNPRISTTQRFKFILYRLCPSFRTMYISFKCKIKGY